MEDNILVKQTANSDEITLKELILKFSRGVKYLRTQLKLILLLTVVGGVLGLSYSFIKKPLYTGTLSFALEDTKSGGGLGAYSGLASQFGLDIGGGGNGGGVFSGDNLIELMKSRTMIQKTLLTTVNINGRNTTLAEFYIDFNGLRDKWADNPGLKDVHFLPNVDQLHFSLKQDSLIGLFHKAIVLNNLAVGKSDKKLSIINVALTSKNELFSKYFVEVLVGQVSVFYIETKTKKSTQNVRILQHQTDSVRQQLNLAISGVAASVDVNPNANPNRAVLRVPSQHRQVDIQVNTAILAELVKNLEIAKVSLRNETPLIQMIDRPVLPLDKVKTGKIVGIVYGSLIGLVIGIVLISVIKLYKNVMA